MTIETEYKEGASCSFHPKLKDLPLEMLMDKHRAAKNQLELISKEVQRRIYEIEKRKK